MTNGIKQLKMAVSLSPYISNKINIKIKVTLSTMALAKLSKYKYLFSSCRPLVHKSFFCLNK